VTETFEPPETSVSAARPTPRTGLSEAEAARRIEARGPIEPPPSSRSYRSIVRANVFTVFNMMLLGFGVVTLAFGNWRDALFLGILVANASIGIVQEARAKRALDRLAALVAPEATVIRDGEPRHVHASELVEGDLVRIQAGDQVVADGVLDESSGLRLDESILTGESHSVGKDPGEELRSGSFAVEGSGLFTVTAVGPASYAERLAGQAREFRHPRSPLERAMNRLLFVLVGVMIPLGAILGYALYERDVVREEAVETSVAAVSTLVPEGLILLVSLTYAVAALRMARRGALAQQLNAVESLASVQVICLDKTGTLTEGTLRVVAAAAAEGVGEETVRAAVARYAASAPDRNATIEALAEAFPAPVRTADASVPFSSARRWSGVRVDGAGYVLGAPELFGLGRLGERVEAEQQRGRRVLAIGATTASFDGLDPDAGPPADLVPLGLVVLAERLRPQARETVRFFLDEGVELKVISGDAPETVAAIAADVGIPVAGHALDGGSLPSDPVGLRQAALEARVVGRISPEGKRRFVEALRDAGRYVAMVGDGVNDVPALKAARLAIAQGGGTQMAKSVADVVLVDGEFGSVPAMVQEGRKVLRNLQRVTKLFVTKSSFAAVLILTIGISPTSYPLLPRHLTLAAALTVGIPSFFLALAPSDGAWRTAGFLRDVTRFALPAGTAAALGLVSSYLFALEVINLPTVEASTVAVTVMVIVGLYFILVLEASGRRRAAAVGGLCTILFALYWLVLGFEPTRDFFELAAPSAAIVLCSLGGSALAIAGLWLTDDRFALTLLEREPGRAGPVP
jgi:P-type E1-E2 ATPase